MADNKEFTQKLLDQKFTTFEDALKHWQAVYDLYFTELKRDITPLSSPPEGKENFVKTEQEERQKLEFMVEKIKTKSTQFALSASGTPKVDEVGPFGLLLLECLVTLLAVFQSTGFFFFFFFFLLPLFHNSPLFLPPLPLSLPPPTAAKSSGKTKITNLQQEIIHVYERVDTLVQKTYVLHIQEKKIDDKTLPPLAGCVWSVCDGIKKVKMRDSGYASIATKNVFRVMKVRKEGGGGGGERKREEEKGKEREIDEKDCFYMYSHTYSHIHTHTHTYTHIHTNTHKYTHNKQDALEELNDTIKEAKKQDRNGFFFFSYLFFSFLFLFFSFFSSPPLSSPFLIIPPHNSLSLSLLPLSPSPPSLPLLPLPLSPSLTSFSLSLSLSLSPSPLP